MGTLTKENKELFDTLIEQATTTGNGAFDFGKDKFDALYKMLYKSPVPLTFNELVHNRDFPVISWEDVSKFTSIAALVGLIKIVPVLPQKLGQVTPGEYHKAELTQMGVMCYGDITGDFDFDVFNMRKIHIIMTNYPGVRHLEGLLYEVEIDIQGFTQTVRVPFELGVFKTEADIFNHLVKCVYNAGDANGAERINRLKRTFATFGEYPLGLKEPSVFGMPGVVQAIFENPLKSDLFDLNPEQQKEFTDLINKRLKDLSPGFGLVTDDTVNEVQKDNSFNCDICFGSGKVSGYIQKPGRKELQQLEPTDCFKCGGSGTIGGVDIAEGKDSGTIQTEIEVMGTDKVHIVTGGRGSGKTHMKHLNIIGEKTRQMSLETEFSFDEVSTTVQQILKNITHKELAEHTNFNQLVRNYMEN
jgi:hypothetical protein